MKEQRLRDKTEILLKARNKQGLMQLVQFLENQHCGLMTQVRSITYVSQERQN